jgi:predicted Zn-dependent protease
MGQFFSKLEGGGGSAFFSDHPNPENRISNVQQEIGKFGGVPARVRSDSPDFQEVKRMLLGMPAPPKNGAKPCGPARG